MADDGSSDFVSGFQVEEVNAIVKENIDSVLASGSYQLSKVNQWTSAIVEQTLSHLTRLNKPYKYIGCCTVRWENKSMYCVVTVFGCAI